MSDAGRNPIYDLLPTVYREADIGQGYPLLALTQVLQATDATLQTGIEALYDSWFIQTCPPELVVQIAALLGLTLPTPTRPEHRALVADTLAVRRRKGTAAALPALLRGASNWYALVLEDGAVPAAAWPLRVPGPHLSKLFVDPDPGRARLLAWRLPVFALDGVDQSGSHLNPLGLPQPVWNVPSTPLPMGVPPVTALPAAITMEMLADDLTRYIGAWPADPASPADSLLYGPGRGLLLRQKITDKDGNAIWSDLPPSAIRAMPLGPGDPPPPDYQVFLSGEIDATAIKTETRQVLATLGDATAQLTYGLDATKSGTADLVEALNTAFQALKLSDITPPEEATPAMLATLQASRAAACGQQLAVVPGDGSFTMFTFDQDQSFPDDESGDDPLQLMNPSGPGFALRTLPLDPALLTSLTALQAVGTLRFNDAGSQTFAVGIPLTAAKPVTIATVAAALQKALQSGQAKATVVTCGDRLVIVSETITTDGSSWTADPQNNPPAMAALAWSLGLTRAIVLNPEDGSLTVPTVGTKPTLQASYGYAAVAPIGGDPRTRPMPAPPAGTKVYPMIAGGEPPQTVAHRWAHEAPPSAMFTLAGSGTFRFSGQAATLTLLSGQSLLIRSAQWQRPLVTIAPSHGLFVMTLEGPADGAPGNFQLDGLLLQGQLAIGDGMLAVTLADITVYPQSKKPALARTANPQSTIQLDLVIMRCILGPMDGTSLSGTLSISDSILSALPVPALDKPVLDKFDATVTPVTLSRCTLLGGATITGQLTATDTLFAGGLASSFAVLSHCYVTGLVVGFDDGALAAAPPSAALVARCPACDAVTGIRLRHSYVQALSLGPAELTGCRCETPPAREVRSCGGCIVPGCEATCPLKGAGRLWTPLPPPTFYPDNAYPQPDFARLADDNPSELLTGASDQGEIGVFNRAAMPARARQFQEALDGALLFGSTTDVDFLS